MAVKALRLLKPAKGANEGEGKGSGCFGMHKKAQRRDTTTNTVVTNSVVIPPEMTECLNKTEWSNAGTKVNSCEVGDDSSDGGTNCTSSDESASVDAGGSSFPMTADMDDADLIIVHGSEVW
jgi:hypothetical protein